MAISSRVLKKKKPDLTKQAEYAALKETKFPNYVVAVTSVKGTRNVFLNDFLGDKGFIIAFQPGASTVYETGLKLFSEKVGAPACTDELLALDEASLALASQGYPKVLIWNTRHTTQHAQVFKDYNAKLKNKLVEIVSDPDGKIASELGLSVNTETLVSANGKVTSHIKFIERVLVWGENKKIQNFTLAASMGVPADYVRTLPARINIEKKSSQAAIIISSFRQGYFFPAPATARKKAIEKAQQEAEQPGKKIKLNGA